MEEDEERMKSVETRLENKANRDQSLPFLLALT